MRPTGAIRDRKYKLVEWFEDGRVELYNLAVDPGETTNLVKSEPKLQQGSCQVFRHGGIGSEFRCQPCADRRKALDNVMYPSTPQFQATTQGTLPMNSLVLAVLATA